MLGGGTQRSPDGAWPAYTLGRNSVLCAPVSLGGDICHSASSFCSESRVWVPHRMARNPSQSTVRSPEVALRALNGPTSCFIQATDENFQPGRAEYWASQFITKHLPSLYKHSFNELPLSKIFQLDNLLYCKVLRCGIANCHHAQTTDLYHHPAQCFSHCRVTTDTGCEINWVGCSCLKVQHELLEDVSY